MPKVLATVPLLSQYHFLRQTVILCLTYIEPCGAVIALNCPAAAYGPLDGLSRSIL